MQKRLIPFLIVVISLALLAFLSQCSSPDPSNDSGSSAHALMSETPANTGYLNLHDSVNYLGSETCKNCHAAIYESFAKTGMGQSFGPPTQAKSSGEFKGKSFHDAFADIYYQPYWKGDSLYLKEYRLDNGDTIYTRNEKVHYIVGSGQHTNSHINSANGYLHQMPFTYYTQKGVLSLPPGFEEGNNSRFSRALGMECLSCHNSYPEHVAGSFNKYENMPLGIGCERCHGPGEAHVKLKKAGVMVDIGKEIDYSIVNPAKLPYEKQKDLCQRCHMQGNAILNKGKNWDDFKPGMDLKDVMNIFMPKLKNEEGSFIMASHPDRLGLSKCFVESANRDEVVSMTCITCHNPHQSVRETKMEYFNTKCLNCHQQEQVLSCPKYSSSTNCIDCHMQKSGTVDIPHVTVTDHYIRVYDDQSDLQSVEAQTETSNADNQDFTGLVCMTQDRPDNLLMAKAYLNFYEKFDPKPAFLDSAVHFLDGLSPTDVPEPFIQLAFLRDDWETLRAIAKKGATTDMSAQSYYRLSVAFAQGWHEDDYEYRISLLRQALKREPLRLDIRNELAIAFLETRKNTEALEEINFILDEYPKDEKAWNTRGFYFLIQNDLIQARQCFERVLKLNPDHENALVNMSKIYIAQNDLETANKWLQRALKAHPNSQSARQIMNQIQLQGK